MALRLTGNFMRNAVVMACRQSSSVKVNYCVSRNLSTKLLNSQSFALTRPSLTYFSTKPGPADTNLSEFLKTEIEQEKQIGKKQLGAQTPSVEGFQIKTDEAEVTLTKSHNNEKITVKFNVNQSVSEEGYNPDFDPEKKPSEELDAPQVWAKPPFQVEIEKNGQRLMFECEYPEAYDDDHHMEGQEAPDDEVIDQFHIEMVYFSNGEVTEKFYGAMGSILDGNLYAHLMDFLDERGVNNKFADDLIKFASYYEHARYVDLLQNIRGFVSK